MLRILFIKKGKNTKTKDFMVLNIRKMILKIVKLKIWLWLISQIEVSHLL